MKTISRLITLASFSFFSAAMADTGNFYKTYPDDDSTQTVQINAGGASSTLAVNGIKYDSKFRLQSFTGKATPQFTMSGPQISKLGLDAFIQKCEFYKRYDLFESVHEDGNQFTLEGEYYPLNKQAMNIALQGLMDETKFNDASFHPVYFEADRGEYVKSAQQTLEQIYSALDRQIQIQRDQIWNSGKVTLNLTGMDALVCDLVTKNTTLKLGAHLGFPEALPRREIIISQDELRQVLEKMENRKIENKNPRENLLMNNLIQNEAMKEVLNKDFVSFGTEKYLKLSNALIDGLSGKITTKSFDSSGVRKVARSLDNLIKQNASQNLIVTPDILVKVK